MSKNKLIDSKSDEARLDAHHKKMTETPIPKLVTRLAIPSILSMLITSIYNMADTYFVSQLGTSAAGAVGVVFSLMAVFQAVGFTLGTGAGNILARQMGAKDSKAANCSASTAFFTAFAIGLLFAVFGHIFIEDLMRLLGATETILPYALAYGRYILLAAPFMCATFVMNCLLRCEGKSSLATIGISTGGILNIILDPIFIFVLDLKTAGAALATALSQLISFLLLLSFFLLKKSNLRLGITRVARTPHVYGRIILTGLPSFSRQGLSSISSMLLNRAAGFYGDAAVAAMSIVSKIVALIFSATLGFLQGYQPVCAFNYGAKRFDRVKKAAFFSGAVCLAATLLIGVGFFLAAPHIITAFRRDDPAVIEIGTLALRFQCVVFPLSTISTLANFSLQSTGQSVHALILASCRQGIFFIPLILILPSVIGLLGIQMTQALSDACTVAISIPFMIHFLRLLDRKQQLVAQEQATIPANQ
ncbi:MAG: MATE family efflux transporter [Oscillospiraceae bacterium]